MHTICCARIIYLPRIRYIT